MTELRGAQSKAGSGFTLIELLVVICVIAILLGIMMPVYWGHTERARERKAIVTAKHLELAFNEYNRQNQRWPGGGGADKDVKDAILTDLIGNGEIKTCYFEIGTNDVDHFFDPWGNYFKVTFDDDYNNEVAAPDAATIHKSVIVWCTDASGEILGSWK